MGQLARKCAELKSELDYVSETTHMFHSPPIVSRGQASLRDLATRWQAKINENEQQIARHQQELDRRVFQLYGIPASDNFIIQEAATTGPDSGTDPETDEVEELPRAFDGVQLATDLLSYAVGCTFGRWDVRLAIGERQAAAVPDPFAPLPPCPPGMLVSENGLPAETPPRSYPLALSLYGILVDDPDHTDDIISRVREVLALLWGDRAEAV